MLGVNRHGQRRIRQRVAFRRGRLLDLIYAPVDVRERRDPIGSACGTHDRHRRSDAGRINREQTESRPCESITGFVDLLYRHRTIDPFVDDRTGVKAGASKLERLEIAFGLDVSILSGKLPKDVFRPRNVGELGSTIVTCCCGECRSRCGSTVRVNGEEAEGDSCERLLVVVGLRHRHRPLGARIGNSKRNGRNNASGNGGSRRVNSDGLIRHPRIARERFAFVEGVRAVRQVCECERAVRVGCSRPLCLSRVNGLRRRL